MKKKLTRAGVLVMCGIMAFSCISCGDSETPEKNNGVVETVSEFTLADVWSTYATEKVLQDVSVSEYASIKQNAELNVDACKGEYESAQLIFSAKKDISSWDASISDLVSVADSSVKLSKDNVTVSAEMYTKVPFNAQNNGMPTGNYPDCLVPMKNFVDSGENTVKNGENQGIYVSIKVPVDQNAGTYKGALTLTIDNERKDIPVTLNVYDLTVNQETHMRSKFNSCFSQAIGELDSTQEMYSKYIDVMLEYRVMPSFLIHQYNLQDTEESINGYCEEAARRVLSGKLTNFNIPSFQYYTSDGLPYPNSDSLYKYILELAKTSIKYNVDLISRAIYTCGEIDEPTINHTENRLRVYTQKYREFIAEAQTKVEALKTTYPESADLIDSMVQSTGNIRLVITTQYDASFADCIDTWCPLFNYYDTEEMRANYDTQEERWWYGCNVPTSPYPTYEIDETLVSPRVASWMMSEYDITGMLYWAVDSYSGNEGYLDDYYGNANRYGNYNGEGYLFYPGAKYGVYGPLSTLRIEAIRDGIEEFELMYNLKKIYAEKGVDHESVFRSICSNLYTGTKISADSAAFYKTRKALIQLCMLADSEAEVVVKDCSQDASYNVVYQVLVKDGYKLMSGGAEVANKTETANGTLYTVTVARSSNVNVMSFSVTTESGTYDYEVSLGGKVTLHGAEALKAGVANGKATVTATEVSGSDFGLQGNVVKIEVSAVSNEIQSFTYTNDVFGNLGKNVSSLILHVYNPSKDDITFSMLAKYSGKTDKRELISTTLKSGMNEIEISSIDAMSWDSLGKIQYIDIYTDATAKGSYDAKTFYFVDAIVYDK